MIPHEKKIYIHLELWERRWQRFIEWQATWSMFWRGKMFAHFNTRSKNLLCNTVKWWYSLPQSTKNIILLRKALEFNEYSSFDTINPSGFMQLLVGWISNRRMHDGTHTLAKKATTSACHSWSATSLAAPDQKREQRREIRVCHWTELRRRKTRTIRSSPAALCLWEHPSSDICLHQVKVLCHP